MKYWMVKYYRMGITLSMLLMSWDVRLRICPMGTESKYSIFLSNNNVMRFMNILFVMLVEKIAHKKDRRSKIRNCDSKRIK